MLASLVPGLGHRAKTISFKRAVLQYLLQLCFISLSSLVKSATLHLWYATVQLRTDISITLPSDLLDLGGDLLVVLSGVEFVDALAQLAVDNFILPHGELQDFPVVFLLGAYQVCLTEHVKFVLDGVALYLLVGINLSSLFDLLFNAGFEVVVAHFFEPLGLDPLVENVILLDIVVLVHELVVLLLESSSPIIVHFILQRNLFHVEVPELSLLLPHLQLVMSVLLIFLLDVDDSHHVPHIELGLAAQTRDFELAIHVVQHGKLAIDRLGHDAVGHLFGD